METLKVSTKSNPNAVAGAVAGAVRQAGVVEIQIVGAGALNQAIKAVAIARGYVTASGIDLVCVPTFADILIDGERRTAIRLSIEDRRGRHGSSAAQLNGTTPAAAGFGQAVVSTAVADPVIGAAPRGGEGDPALVGAPAGVAGQVDRGTSP